MRAKLKGASLTGTSPSGAILTGADLEETSLYGADMEGANLEDIRNCDITRRLRDAEDAFGSPR